MSPVTRWAFRRTSTFRVPEQVLQETHHREFPCGTLQVKDVALTLQQLRANFQMLRAQQKKKRDRFITETKKSVKAEGI